MRQNVFGHIQHCELKKLYLDSKNPRLAERFNKIESQQVNLLEILYKKENLEELAESFAKHGYFPQEPLVAIPLLTEEGTFIVVEGNRRLAALRLLVEPKIRARLGISTFPIIHNDRLHKLKNSIPVVLFNNRSDIIPYLGFRHITGVKTWDLYAKAKYIAFLVENNKMSLDMIGESLGDISGTVKSLYQAYIVLGEIQELGIDDRVIKSEFSFLKIALGNPSIKKFLGMPKDLPIKETSSLVKDMKNFKLMIGFIFGIKEEGIKRVIKEKQDISDKLSYVVENEEACQRLVENRLLQDTYDLTFGGKKLITRSLSNAERELSKALSNIPIYLPNNDQDVLRKIDILQRLLDAVKNTSRDVISRSSEDPSVIT